MESSNRFQTHQTSRRQRVARWLIPGIAVAITVGATVAWQAKVASAAEECPGGTTELGPTRDLEATRRAHPSVSPQDHLADTRDVTWCGPAIQ